MNRFGVSGSDVTPLQLPAAPQSAAQGVRHEVPQVILQGLGGIEREVAEGMKALEGMLG